MNALETNNIIIIAMVIVVVIISLWFICIAMANDYVKKNKEQLFDATSPLSKQCRELGIKLLQNQNTYFMYINNMGLNQIYHCSRTIVSNAENNPIKYLIKYSYLDNDMIYIEQLDFCIDYMRSLSCFDKNMKELCAEIKKQLPTFVSIFASTIKMPFVICDISMKINEIKKPVFCFMYESPAGKSSWKYEIEITNDVLGLIQTEIEALINKKGHIKVQRNAMTNDLREAIKKRDNYTCCICGNSVFTEPNLLLEVDHIIPVSKGGKTEASNLQTLCWRCNRTKANK